VYSPNQYEWLWMQQVLSAVFGLEIGLLADVARGMTGVMVDDSGLPVGL